MKYSAFTFLFLVSSLTLADEGWPDPDESDRESTCRTILFETNSSSDTEEILILSSAYKVLCKKNQTQAVIEYTDWFNDLSLSPSLSNRVACVSSTGFVQSSNGNGWDHNEIEKYKLFNLQTNGGWDHKEIQNFMSIKPLIIGMDSNQLNAVIQLSKQGITPVDASAMLKLKNFDSHKLNNIKLNGQIQTKQ